MTRITLHRCSWILVALEPPALAGFDVVRCAPALVRIEALMDARQAILDDVQRHGDVLIGKYLRADVKNLYFLPATKDES